MKPLLLVISGLDTLLVLLLTLLLAYGAVVYDQNKGIGKDNYLPVKQFQSDFLPEGKDYPSQFFAIILEPDQTSIYEYNEGKKTLVGTQKNQTNANELIEKTLAKGLQYVIYDVDTSPERLGETTRILSRLGASFGIAHGNAATIK